MIKNIEQHNIRSGRSSNIVGGREDQAAQHHEDKTKPRSVTRGRAGIMKTRFQNTNMIKRTRSNKTRKGQELSTSWIRSSSVAP